MNPLLTIAAVLSIAVGQADEVPPGGSVSPKSDHALMGKIAAGNSAKRAELSVEEERSPSIKTSRRQIAKQERRRVEKERRQNFLRLRCARKKQNGGQQAQPSGYSPFWWTQGAPMPGTSMASP